MPPLTKKELRLRVRQAVEAISPEDLHARSVRACNLLIGTPEYQRAEIVMVFLSLPNEVDTTSLVLHSWRDRKRVLAPKVSWEQRRMLPIEIRSLSDDVSQSPMGIREPAQGMPIPVSLIDLVVVPGLGFDVRGNRIGRGRGFYDRFLAHPDWKGIACGLALEEQVVEDVPVTEHDMQVDMLVTDAAVRRFGA
jgi:5-formyltetrahydrofolate cyclo-ligase